MHNLRILIAASVAASLSLAACNSEPETIQAGGADPQAEELAKAAPVAPPPMIQASRTYRCKDNSLVYIDFYTNNTAQVRSDKGGTPTTLTAAQPGGEFTAEGYTLSGNAPTVTLAMPGKGSQSCKA